MKVKFESIAVLAIAVVVIVGAMVLVALDKLSWEQAYVAIAGAIGLVLPGAWSFKQAARLSGSSEETKR